MEEISTVQAAILVSTQEEAIATVVLPIVHNALELHALHVPADFSSQEAVAVQPFRLWIIVIHIKLAAPVPPAPLDTISARASASPALFCVQPAPDSTLELVLPAHQPPTSSIRCACPTLTSPHQSTRHTTPSPPPLPFFLKAPRTAIISCTQESP